MSEESNKYKNRSIELLRKMCDDNFPEEEISKRPGAKGKILSFIEGTNTKHQLNRIFGFDGWADDTLLLQPCYETKQVTQSYYDAKQKKNIETTFWKSSYKAIVKISIVRDGQVITWRTGSGSGHGKDPNDPGLAEESALKEAETDALKRAAHKLGKRLGLALYPDENKEMPFVGEPMYDDNNELTDRGEYLEWTEKFGAAETFEALQQLNKEFNEHIQNKPLGETAYNNLKKAYIARYKQLMPKTELAKTG